MLSDKSDGFERTKFWRAYTASMLFQNPVISTDLVKERNMHHLRRFAQIFGKERLQDSGFRLDPHPDADKRVQQIMLAAAVLYADIRCQRAAYGMDLSVAIGDVFDETRMDDIKMTDMEEIEQGGQVAVVGCILSRGWVKDSGGFKVIICKSRVMIRLVEKSEALRGGL